MTTKATTILTSSHADDAGAISTPTAADQVQPLMTSAIREGISAEVPTPAEPEYTDDDRVTVTCNFGAKDEISQRFWVGNTQFTRDRIARNVRYADAKALQKQFAPGIMRVHPNSATEAEIARRCGVRPAEPAKVAAMLLASDLDAIAAQMKPEELEYLAKALRDRAIQRGHEVTN